MNWRRWFGKQPERRSTDPPVSQGDRVAELIEALGRNGRLAELDQELAAMRHVRLSEQEERSWHVLWTANAFRRGDRSEAFARATAASQALSNDPEVAFALGQEHEFRGDVDEMVRCFLRAPFPAVSAAHTLAAVRYCSLRGRFDAGLELLAPVLTAHFELRIADDTFLYLRRMPFASVSFATGVCLHLLNRDASGAGSLLRRAAATLVDSDLSDLEPLAEAHERGDPGIAVRALESRRAGHLSAGPLGGFSGVQFATWRSRSAGTASEARAALSRVALREDDHAWLEDVRTLCLAEVAYRFGERDEESRLVRAFIERQPLLFEPHWALLFGFVGYLERVKSAFWLAATGRDRRAPGGGDG